MTQRNTPDSLAWLKHQHDVQASSWGGLCQKLTRSARNLPPLFPSAFAQIQGTPMSDRVHDVDQMQAGMPVMFDDPNDNNPFAHIATLRTRQKDGTWLVWSNDALGHGRVWCVDLTWFQRHWGDPMVFASKSLNGFDLILPRSAERKHPSPPAKKQPTLDNYDYAIHRLQKALTYHKNHDHPRYVRALTKEINDLRNIQKGKLT